MVRRWQLYLIDLAGELLYLNEEMVRRSAFLADFAGQRGAGEMRFGSEHGVLPGPEPVGPSEAAIYKEDIRVIFRGSSTSLPGPPVILKKPPCHNSFSAGALTSVLSPYQFPS